MRKKLFFWFLGFALSCLPSLEIYGQATQTVSLSKGEVLDILLLSQNPDTEAALKSYFQNAFPVAKRMSYQPMPGFKIKDHTQGNHRPASLILGKWLDMEKRETFISQILEEVPDFHERRRKIWSYFGLGYFEIQKDLTFEIDRNKFHVATAYWMKGADVAISFDEKWEAQINQFGGKLLIDLKDGNSPFGYLYDPDYFLITVWENEAAFKTFQEQVQTITMDAIEHVNEFILD